MCSCSPVDDFRGLQNKGAAEDTSSTESTEIIESTTALNFTYTLSDEPVEIDYGAKELYGKDQTGIVLKDGKVSGKLKINFTEKLGIWDYNNTKVVAAGVKYGYAINLDLDMTELMSEVDIATILVEPVLYNKAGEVIGGSANLGWSGFSTFAELYPSTPTCTLEVNLQPYVRNVPDGSYVGIRISDKLTGVLYDELFYNLELLTTAKKGPSLLKENKTKVIKSINGAKYEFSILNAYCDENQVDIDDRKTWAKFYDIKYHLKYTKKPTKKNREVANFDSFNKYKLNTSVVLGVNSDVDSTLLYYNTKNAARYIWSDRNDVELYVTTTKWPILPGKTASLWVNRMLPKTTTEEPTNIRIRVEFPEEADARTTSELSKFNGRYLVYQIEVTNRPLEPERD